MRPSRSAIQVIPDQPNATGRYRRRSASTRFGTRIGRGAKGRVAEAHDTELDRVVAIKFVRHLSESLADRLRREARAAARLDHPHIIRIYNLVRDGNVFGIVMQLVHGRPLQRQEIAPDRVLIVAYQIIDAIAYAHARGVLHRDIKPDNVLVAEDGTPLVGDFGLARIIPPSGSAEPGDPVAQAATAAGTPGFMAPEQITGESVGRWTDVYGVGALLYFMLARQPPFVAPNTVLLFEAMREQEPPAPSGTSTLRFSDEQWAHLDGIVQCCLQKQPRLRFQTVDELKQHFGRLLGPDQVFDLRLKLPRFEPARSPVDMFETKTRDAPGPGRPSVQRSAAAATTPEPEESNWFTTGVPPVSRVAGYELEHRIDEDGMLVRWRTTERESGRIAQIRIPRLGMDTAQILKSFEAEVRLRQRLPHHPGLLPFLEGGRDESGRPYLIEQHVECVPISDLDLPFEELARIVAGVCDTVSHLHAEGLVHGDIKPSRVLVDRRHHPYLSELIIAVIRSERLYAEGSIVGTPGFMSPEHLRGPAWIDAQSDVFQLGGLLYACISGRPPHELENRNFSSMRQVIRENDRPAARRIVRATPVGLGNIIEKAMATAPGERYESAAALRDDLERWRQGRSPAAQRSRWPWRR